MSITNVYVLFSENAGQWGERGTLRRSPTGFVLDVAPDLGGGTRVFPIAGRTAEVYRSGEDEPCVVTRDGEVIRDQWGQQ